MLKYVTGTLSRKVFQPKDLNSCNDQELSLQKWQKLGAFQEYFNILFNPHFIL